MPHALAILAVALCADPGAAARGPAHDFALLLEPPAVCGFEEALVRRIEASLPEGLHRERDALGSLIVRPDGPDAPVARLVAVGMDEPGYVVSAITDDGYLRLRTLGVRGAAFHQLREGRPTTVWTGRGPLAGVILVDSTHLGAARPEELGEEHLFVDVGADDAAEARALGVELLDPVLWREVSTVGDRLAAPSAGNRAAAWALLALIVQRENELAGRGLAFAFVCQSRLGGGRLGRGLSALRARLAPQETLVLRAQDGLDAPFRIPQAPDADGVRTLALRCFDRGAPSESVSLDDAERLLGTLGRELLGAEVVFERHCVAETPAPQPAFTPTGHTETWAVLERLVRARGVSGDEAEIREVILEEIARIDGKLVPQIDGEGNVLVQLGSGPRTLLFVAHMDEVGLEVQRVREDGLCEMRRRGGFYEHLYLGSPVEVRGAKGVVPGVTRPALERDPAAGSATGGGARLLQGRILLDVGARSSAEVRRLGLGPGATATEPKLARRLGPHRAAARSFDDRVGCTALLLALRSLASRSLDRRVVLAWVVREEVGLEGSGFLAREGGLAPQLVFPVDTFVSSDSPRNDPRFAFAPLGGGPVLRALDSTSITPRRWVKRLRAIAGEADLAVQIGTMNGGNDGSPFVSYGAVDCPLAWPQRCSHSRVETADLRDLEALSRLIAAVATRI